MSIRTMLPPIEPHLALSSTPPPWIPLEGLIQFWATFSQDADEMPQTADALTAISQAFAALAKERTALQSFSLTAVLRRHYPPRVRTVEEEWSEEETLTGQDAAIELLAHASAHWRKVAYALEQIASHSCQQETALQYDLLVLVAHVCSQRLRVWTIAQHLLQEDLASYRTHAGITTDLFDDGDEQVKGDS